MYVGQKKCFEKKKFIFEKFWQSINFWQKLNQSGHFFEKKIFFNFYFSTKQFVGKIFVIQATFLAF
jgi:hypothetical protein